MKEMQTNMLLNSTSNFKENEVLAIFWFMVSMWCSYMCVSWFVSLFKKEPQYIYINTPQQPIIERSIVQNNYDEQIMKSIDANLKQMHENIKKIAEYNEQPLTYGDENNIIIQNTLKNLGIDGIKYD